MEKSVKKIKENKKNNTTMYDINMTNLRQNPTNEKNG